MSEPPRRRRSPSSEPPRRSSGGSSLLPTIALGIGVIVAGLGIGAFFSAMQSKGHPQPTTATSGGAPVITPVPQPSRGPVVIATMVAHPTPTPAPAPTPTPEPSATAAPTPTPRVTAKPSSPPRPSAPPAAVAAATAAPPSAAPQTVAPQATTAPTRVPPPTPPPARVTPAAVVVTPRPATPSPAATIVARVTPDGFNAVAQGTVRRYLDALIAGNENAAYAALGKAAGDPGAQLSEEAFIDRGARITSIRTRSTDATGETIDAEIASSRGTYYATYHVTNGPAGPIIDQHDYIKV
jgi:hypothetical protein